MFEKCSNNCSEANEKRSCAHKLTVRNNPEISIEQSRQFRKTIGDNPEIIKNRVDSFKNTLKNNPEVQEKINRGISLWAEKNPLDAREKSLKGAETLRRNSDKIENKRKNISISLRNRYKKLKEGKSHIPYYLYLIKHLSKPIVKIGIAEMLEKRLKDINRDFGESEIIFSERCCYKEANMLEDYLHDYFEPFCKIQPSGSGKTEWFDECILEEAIIILNERGI